MQNRPVPLAPPQFDPDQVASPAVALRLELADNASEIPIHQHKKGQLIFALKGGVICEVPDALWMVPPNCAVWVPGGMPHSNRATANARLYFLFVDPDAARMPQACCTLVISPLLRELILHLADQPRMYAPDSALGRLARVALDELEHMPVEQLHLPISDEPRVRAIAHALADNPADRSTLAQWGRRFAMSERTLTRLVRKETGLSFGRWRQQLQLIIALRQLSAGASVQQVSGELGYESVTAFITMFKKSLGQPPARYFASMARRGQA